MSQLDSYTVCFNEIKKPWWAKENIKIIYRPQTLEK